MSHSFEFGEFVMTYTHTHTESESKFFTGDMSNDIHSPGPVIWEVGS